MQARALTNTKQQTNINIESTEQSKQSSTHCYQENNYACMQSDSFHSAGVSTFEHVHCVSTSSKGKTRRNKIFIFIKKANMKNKQTNVYEWSKSTRWTNGAVASWLTVERRNKQREKELYFQKKNVCVKSELKWKWNAFADVDVRCSLHSNDRVHFNKKGQRKKHTLRYKQHENNRVLKLMHDLTRRGLHNVKSFSRKRKGSRARRKLVQW